MKWRLREGNGEALYILGCADDGQLKGLSQADMETSLQTVYDMARTLDAATTVVRERLVDNNRKVVEVLVRKSLHVKEHFLEIRIAIIGSNESGKSTFLGVVAHGQLDNGKGK